MTYQIPTWHEYRYRHSEDSTNHDLQRRADVSGENVIVTTPRGNVWQTFEPEV